MTTETLEERRVREEAELRAIADRLRELGMCDIGYALDTELDVAEAEREEAEALHD